METIIPILLAISFVLCPSTAMADRDYRSNDQRYYTSQEERIKRHLDIQGDRIERRFDHKAERAVEQGKYRQARHFHKKGSHFNRHLDRKGKKIHTLFDRSTHNRQIRYHHYRNDAHVAHPPRGYRHDNSFSLIIQQPGFLFGWGWNH